MATTRALSRAQLRDLRSELESEQARLARALESDGGVAVAQDHVQTRREAIGAALQRLESGTYGVCSGCRQSIPFGRLLVMPETTYCVGCGPRL